MFWDFGDGSILIIYDVYYVYFFIGIYMVFLMAYVVIIGCLNIFEVEVEVQFLFNLLFMLDVIFGCFFLQVGVDNMIIDVEYFVWYFGDGNLVVGQNLFFYVYQEFGFYDIWFEVIDIFGCFNDIVFLFINVYLELVIDFEVVLDEFCGIFQEVCIFNDMENVFGFFWFFGNGSILVENVFCIVFNEVGIYMILLIVQNEFLCI